MFASVSGALSQLPVPRSQSSRPAVRFPLAFTPLRLPSSKKVGVTAELQLSVGLGYR